MNQSYTPKAITLESIYNSEMMNIPQGWRGIAFRPPKFGEMFLSSNSVVCGQRALSTNETYPENKPRIILEKIPAPRRYSIVLEEMPGFTDTSALQKTFIETGNVMSCPNLAGSFKVVSTEKLR